MKLSTRTRSGMSIVEFVACLSAMVGGVILGSLYLGVDVKQMGLAVLKQARLVDATSEPTEAATDVKPATESKATPAETTEVAAAAPVEALKPAASTSEQTAESAETPVAESTPSAETPASAETTASGPAPAASDPLSKLFNRDDLISLTDEQRRTLTLAYWEALDACMKEEVHNRLASISPDGNWTLFDFLTCRKKGHQEAADFIAGLNLRGVDPHVAAYAEKALAWHRDGVKLFGRALDLLTDAPTAQFTGPFAQSWQSASTQHQMEERLLAEKHQAVETYLDHTLNAAATTTAAAAPADATTQAPAAAEPSSPVPSP